MTTGCHFWHFQKGFPCCRHFDTLYRTMSDTEHEPQPDMRFKKTDMSEFLFDSLDLIWFKNRKMSDVRFVYTLCNERKKNKFLSLLRIFVFEKSETFICCCFCSLLSRTNIHSRSGARHSDDEILAGRTIVRIMSTRKALSAPWKFAFVVRQAAQCWHFGQQHKTMWWMDCDVIALWLLCENGEAAVGVVFETMGISGIECRCKWTGVLVEIRSAGGSEYR